MRHEWIDAIKGYGIILVVATHSNLFQGLPTALLYLTAGYIAMFFIVSGYTTKAETFNKGVRQKACRLLLPYFFYGTILTLFRLIFECLPHSFVNKLEWAGLAYSRYSLYPLGTENNTQLLSGKSTAPLWFLTAMFVAYIWFYAYSRLKTTTQKAACVITLFIATAATAHLEILLPWSIDTSFICAIFIIIGYELKEYIVKSNITLSGKTIVAMLALCVVYIVTTRFNGLPNLSVREYGNFHYTSIALMCILSTTGTILVTQFFKAVNNTFITKSLAFIGRHSLRIMCIHMPIVSLSTKYIWGGNHYAHAFQFLIAFGATLLLSMLLELIYTRLSKRYKLVKYL